MKVCYTAGPVKKLENCFSVSTNAVEIRIWFLTDDILRIRAGFDGDWDEASYSLTMTAWDSRTDELMKDCRKRVQPAEAALTDGGKQAVSQKLSDYIPVHSVSSPKINSVAESPSAMQTIRISALTAREIPTSTCPSSRSKIELISGTPGIRNSTLVPRAVSGVVPR